MPRGRPKKINIEDTGDEIVPEKTITPVNPPVTPYVITQDQFDDLWEAWGTGYSAELNVDRKALMAAFQDYGNQPGGVVASESRINSKYVSCYREGLGDFLLKLRKHYANWDEKLRADSK